MGAGQGHRTKAAVLGVQVDRWSIGQPSSSENGTEFIGVVRLKKKIVNMQVQSLDFGQEAPGEG